MKVLYKILVAPAVAILFLLVCGAVSYGVVVRQNAALDELAKARLAGIDVAMSAAQDISEVHSGVYRLFTWVANITPEQVKSETADKVRVVDEVHARLALFRAEPGLSQEEVQLVDAVLPLLTQYRKQMADAIDVSTGDVTMGTMLMQAADKQFQSIVEQLDTLVLVEKTRVQQSYDAASAAFRQALTALLAIVLAAVAASLVIAVAMSRRIVRPLQVAMRAADRIAGGDLTSDIQVRGSDETAQLLRSLAAMTDNLRQLVGEVAGGAHVVADTSAQIAQGNQDLSQRTEEQAGTLEETASSMEELTSTVSLNAQNARQASQLSVGASEIARKGGAVVGQVVSTMAGISESSKKIGDIIGVIDGIAFQTNILALNAAVEAARAGEQGRGFAVVASEVRNLAQRSAAAAKEIKGLIGESVDKVDAGARLVDSAGRTMEEIVASVKKVSDLVAEIAAASEEQDAGIQQVNTAITQMDQVVQQNASLVEEAAAATESMKGQAAGLLQMVSRFKLGEGHAAFSPLQVAPRREPAREEPVAPIKVKPAPAPATEAPLFAAAAAPAAGNGEWKEF